MAVQRYDPVSDLTPTTTAKVDLVTLVQLYPVSYQWVKQVSESDIFIRLSYSLIY